MGYDCGMQSHADALASMAEAAQLRGEFRRASDLFRQAAVEYGATRNAGLSSQMSVKARTAAAAAAS